jgi:glycosyltransferase involved in cell wall biosynthesis
VVREFPAVILVREPRKGLSYARNSGIAASHGEIILTTDDDVIIPSDWVEKLVASFSNPQVMITTGNIIPFSLETKAQLLFEAYGGLGRGFHRHEKGLEWFRATPRACATWRLGATANAAFRARIFADPKIGMLNEVLGPGTPTGVGEDTYIFYKVLKSGSSIVYEPDAYVRHKHRRSMVAFRRQIVNYSKGHVAYHLVTLFRDHDLRGLVRIFAELPLSFWKRSRQTLRGESIYPLSLILTEVLASLLGPFSLVLSWCRVRYLGRSQRYVSPERRNSKQ